jgi:hypothetical protein
MNYLIKAHDLKTTRIREKGGQNPEEKKNTKKDFFSGEKGWIVFPCFNSSPLNFILNKQ